MVFALLVTVPVCTSHFLLFSVKEGLVKGAVSAAGSAILWLADQPALCHERLAFLELGTSKGTGPKIKLLNKATMLLKQ